MERCAVTESLNRHQEKLKNQETSYELLCDAIDDDLCEISDLIKKVLKQAENYDNYDFTDEVKELIRDLI